ncbi:uncharacterized protein BJ171DRAFT_539066 [Polychytrium aggregatum]|uniref:uncharacterized protein n=1 Tax=Polychytrium aggregatum TaxID=110093 RepID=UPI0022FEEF59|nr:uncharacterized protein BJ171DRAFT_539066 [Polychytrium aggregatum]KAI9190831.1 hypothetical protein BJ171DRAFT_539066 [Polychytrium aggregatum]
MSMGLKCRPRSDSRPPSYSEPLSLNLPVPTAPRSDVLFEIDPMGFKAPTGKNAIYLGVVFFLAGGLLWLVQQGLMPTKYVLDGTIMGSSCTNEALLVEELVKWRKIAGKMMCRDGADTGPTGGWCLVPSQEDWGIPYRGRAAANHVPADEGIGATIVKFLDGSSIVDIGAGVGQYGFYLKNHGANIDYRGYDGAENVEEYTDGFLKWMDATNPLMDTIQGRADWVLSLEIGEHVPAEKTEELLNTFDRHNRYGVILSWAVIGQDGHHHINNKNNDEVVRIMENHGYYQDSWALDFQKEGRAAAQYFWFKSTFMVFKRRHPVVA